LIWLARGADPWRVPTASGESPHYNTTISDPRIISTISDIVTVIYDYHICSCLPNRLDVCYYAKFVAGHVNTKMAVHVAAVNRDFTPSPCKKEFVENLLSDKGQRECAMLYWSKLISVYGRYSYTLFYAIAYSYSNATFSFSFTNTITMTMSITMSKSKWDLPSLTVTVTLTVTLWL